MCDEKWICYNSQQQPAQWLDWEEAPKHFPKPNLYQKKRHGHCSVVCWQSDPLQLSESWQNHNIWEVRSANQWYTPKIAVPAAGIGQQKRAQFFSTTISEFMLHNQCFKGWMNWAVKFCLICHIHLTSRQLMDGGAWQATVHGVTKSRTRLRNFHFTSLHSPTNYHFFKDLDHFFCRENTSTTNRIQKMLSKSLWNPKAGIFKLQE